jgi:cell division GTPase FtsZ
MGMAEVNEVAKIITESVDLDARIIFGATFDPRLKANELKVTVIAAGFDAELRQLPLEPGARQPAFFTKTAPLKSELSELPENPSLKTAPDGVSSKTQNESRAQTRDDRASQGAPAPNTRALQDLLDKKLADDSEFETPAFFRKKRKN